jgi:hypothetical protein
MFNAPCIRPKIRCDRKSYNFFGILKQLNTPFIKRRRATKKPDNTVLPSMSKSRWVYQTELCARLHLGLKFVYSTYILPMGFWLEAIRNPGLFSLRNIL